MNLYAWIPAVGELREDKAAVGSLHQPECMRNSHLAAICPAASATGAVTYCCSLYRSQGLMADRLLHAQ